MEGAASHSQHTRAGAEGQQQRTSHANKSQRAKPASSQWVVVAGAVWWRPPGLTSSSSLAPAACASHCAAV